MLKLKRRLDEGICIGESLKIFVSWTKDRRAYLYVCVPEDLPVSRIEVGKKIKFVPVDHCADSMNIHLSSLGKDDTLVIECSCGLVNIQLLRISGSYASIGIDAPPELGIGRLDLQEA